MHGPCMVQGESVDQQRNRNIFKLDNLFRQRMTMTVSTSVLYRRFSVISDVVRGIVARPQTADTVNNTPLRYACLGKG